MPKILIVEDDQTISKLIAASLSISGYESVPCFDGNEAVHMVRNEEFDRFYWISCCQGWMAFR